MEAYYIKIDSEIDKSLSKTIENHLSKADGEDIFIDIDSYGGDPNMGVAIFASLRRYAKKNNAKVTTRSAGYVASAATLVFLAGDIRIVNEFMQPFIHEPYLAWNDNETASDFEQTAKELNQIRLLMAKFYSSNTDMTEEQALELMAHDTWVNPDMCIELGFATEIEKLNNKDLQIVASIKSKLINKNEKMSKQKSKLAFYERIMNAVKPFKAELTLAGVDDRTIVFPELDEEATPSVGDSVVVDGDASYSGEVETNNFIFTVEEGKVSAILDKTEIDYEEVIEALIQKNEELEAKLKNSIDEKEKYAKLYNSIGKKSKADSSRRKIETEDEDSGVQSKVKGAFNKAKNK